MILVSLFRGFNCSLVPRPSQKVEDGLVFRAIFLVTWGGAIFQWNDIIAYLNLELEFLMPRCIWTTTRPHLQKLDMGANLLGQLKTGCETHLTTYILVQNKIIYAMQI